MGAFLASGGSSGTEGLDNFFYHAGEIWVIVFLVDVVLTVLTGARRGTATVNADEPAV